MFIVFILLQFDAENRNLRRENDKINEIEKIMENGKSDN